MKLRYVQGPRANQKELTAMTTLGVFKWTEFDQVVEVPDQAAHEILAKWPGCVEQVKPGPKKKVDSDNKMTFSPENKSFSSSSVAE